MGKLISCDVIISSKFRSAITDQTRTDGTQDYRVVNAWIKNALPEKTEILIQTLIRE